MAPRTVASVVTHNSERNSTTAIDSKTRSAPTRANPLLLVGEGVPFLLTGGYCQKRSSWRVSRQKAARGARVPSVSLFFLGIYYIEFVSDIFKTLIDRIIEIPKWRRNGLPVRCRVYGDRALDHDCSLVTRAIGPSSNAILYSWMHLLVQI